jgi:hypothetical protein
MDETSNSDKFNSSLLKIQSLENDFTLLMKQYEEAHLNYINSLNTTSNTSTTDPTTYLPMISIPGSTWNGTSTLTEGAVSSIDECKAMCSADTNCSGATYNSTKSYCWVRTGKGEIQISVDTADNAIVSELTQNLTTIQSLNKRLSDLSQQIDTELNKILPEASKEIDSKNASKGKLQSIYQQLKEDRIKIDKQLKEYKKIDTDYIDTNIYVNEKNSKYILWGIFALSIFFYTIKTMFFPGISSNIFSFIFWIVMAILFMITATRLNSSAGFLLWGIIITLVIFIQMKFIPSP